MRSRGSLRSRRGGTSHAHGHGVRVRARALEPVSAKTIAPVDRERVKEVARAIASLTVSLPVRAGDVLAVDIAGTGVSVVATKDVDA